MRRSAWSVRAAWAAALVGLCAGAAHASVTGFRWREIDNSAATPGMNGWVAGNRTFDLLIVGTAADLVNGLGAGGDNNPIYGIRIVGGTGYNTPVFGQNIRSTAFENVPGLTEIRFDTYCCFGGDPAPGGPGGTPTQFAGTIDHVGADGRINFTSFASSPTPLAPDAQAPGGFSLRVLRITVGADTQHLGDEKIDTSSLVQIGQPGGVLLDFTVPDAINPFGRPQEFAVTDPAPGAACLAVSPAPTFHWNSAGFADTYDLIIASDPAFASVVYSVTGLTTTSHTPPLWTIDRGEARYWKVIARNTIGFRNSTPNPALFSTVPDGDVDQNGAVVFADLNFVLSAYGAHAGSPAYNPLADLDHNETVEFGDLNVVLSAFGTMCGR